MFLKILCFHCQIEANQILRGYKMSFKNHSSVATIDATIILKGHTQRSEQHVEQPRHIIHQQQFWKIHSSEQKKHGKTTIAIHQSTYAYTCLYCRVEIEHDPPHLVAIQLLYIAFFWVSMGYSLVVFLPKNTLSDTFYSWNFGAGDGSVGFVESCGLRMQNTV